MAESNNFALHLERYLKTLLQQGKSEHTVLQLAGADRSYGKRPDI